MVKDIEELRDLGPVRPAGAELRIPRLDEVRPVKPLRAEGIIKAAKGIGPLTVCCPVAQSAGQPLVSRS